MFLGLGINLQCVSQMKCYNLMKKIIEEKEETVYLSSNEENLVKGGIVPFSSLKAELKDRLLLEDRLICASHVRGLIASILKEGHVVVTTYI